MVWQSYESQNILSLDEPMAHKLNLYLDRKELELSEKINETLLPFQESPPEVGSSLPLNQGIEVFGRKVNQLVKQGKMITSDQWKSTLTRINELVWNHVEMLEGCIVELFQQIDQMGFEQWNEDVLGATTSIKSDLTHRIDDVIWAIRRIEQELRHYKNACGNEGVFRIKNFFLRWTSLLDRSLQTHLKKSKKFLNFRYCKFVERYGGYLQLYESVNQSMVKFHQSVVLSSMEIHQQDKIKELNFLLKVWEDNQKSRILQRIEPVRALRNCASFENALGLFRDYTFSLREAIFNKSRLIKKQFRLVFIDQSTKQPLIDNVGNYLKELHALKEFVIQYKKFHLETDPGLTGWVNWVKRGLTTAQEMTLPHQFKELDTLKKEINSLEVIAASFKSSLEKESVEKGLTSQLVNEVNKHLHEMWQPLTSKNLMESHAKALLHSLEALDEIASFDPHSVDFVCRTLCKAMCVDWKYHVLQEIPLFHQIYDIHQGIFNISYDRMHLNRLHKFQSILNKLEIWIKNDETLNQAQEMMLNINDIKSYLQDFLAYVQNLEPEEEDLLDSEKFERPIGMATQAFLQYLYLFGKFFSHLIPENSEHRLIRKQLLFIDQYFEAIDRKLQQLFKNSGQ